MTCTDEQQYKIGGLNSMRPTYIYGRIGDTHTRPQTPKYVPCVRVCACVRHGAREFSNYSEADDFFFFLCVGCSVRPVGVWILGGGVLSVRKSIIRTPRLGQREWPNVGKEEEGSRGFVRNHIDYGQCDYDGLICKFLPATCVHSIARQRRQRFVQLRLAVAVTHAYVHARTHM